MLVAPKVFGLGVTAHVRMRAMPVEVKRTAQMFIDTREVVEADCIAGEGYLLAKLVVSQVQNELQIGLSKTILIGIFYRSACATNKHAIDL